MSLILRDTRMRLMIHYQPGNLLLFVNYSLLLQIRRKMREIMVNQATSCDLKELVRKFIPESIGKEIEKATSSIYPLQNVFIRKVKILKAPKFDLGKLMEVYNYVAPLSNLLITLSPTFLPSIFIPWKIHYKSALHFACFNLVLSKCLHQLRLWSWLQSLLSSLPTNRFHWLCIGSWWLFGRCWRESR